MLQNTNLGAWSQERSRPDVEFVSFCLIVKVIPSPPAEPVIDEDEGSVIVLAPASTGVSFYVLRNVQIGKNGLVVLASMHDYLVWRSHHFRDFFSGHVLLKTDHVFLVLVGASTSFRWTVSATRQGYSNSDEAEPTKDEVNLQHSHATYLK